MIPLLGFLAVTAGFPVTKTVEISPGVFMPTVSLGGVHSKPSNYSLFLTLGGTSLDTALMYGDDVQQEVGKAVRTSSLKREEIFVTTKVPCCPATTDFNVTCKESWNNPQQNIQHDLDMLGLSYVDLMLVHWPCATKAETLATYVALEEMLQANKTRAIGVSNFRPDDLEYILQYAKTPPAVNQCQMSIGKHDDETIRYCQAHNITYEAWSPLGGLSGVDVLNDPDVKRIGTKYNVSAAQVALRWVAQYGATFVTAGHNKEYLVEDLDIFGFELSKNEMKLLARK